MAYKSTLAKMPSYLTKEHFKDQMGIDDEYKPITSAKTVHYFTNEHYNQQIQLILKASEVAQKKIDYSTAHDEHILYAIEIVEKFLRKSGRICYGGQAINAHLPESYKIYDPTYSIPDYDVFTPSPLDDIDYLVDLLQKAGFEEISIREGMHEGTTKIYVDYVPVLDLTAIHPRIYKTLYKRSAIFDRIHYLDANLLRMLMHLELSRPRGQVTRWSKVFERLMIFNEFVPLKPCAVRNKDIAITANHVTIIINFIIKNKSIFAGADLIDFYESSLHIKDTNLHITSKKPIIFFSSHSYDDAVKLVSQLKSITYHRKHKFSIQTVSIHKTDMIPYFTLIKYGKYIIACIIEYSACHSYVTVQSSMGILKIASMDTLITLYFSLGLVHTPLFNIGSMECMASKLVEISMKSRYKHDNYIFPFISVKCSGYQATLPSLIRAKVNRITQKKRVINRKTYKN